MEFVRLHAIPPTAGEGDEDGQGWMNKVTLYSDRVVARRYSDEETVRPASLLDLSRFFFYSLELDPTFTLGDLFRLVDQDDAELLEIVLDEHIAPLLEEASTAPSADVTGQIEFLRVYNIHEDGALHRGFDGWGIWPPEYDDVRKQHPELPREGPLSVSLTPLRELLDVPLRYDPELIVHDPDGAGEFRTGIDITLIEFLKAIFADLTFHGTPDERNETRAELSRRMHDIERGAADLTASDEVLGALRKRFGRAGGP
ncbi:hypothetical protein BH23GEM9_BH23GEM9_32080 [soil metagenome]